MQVSLQVNRLKGVLRATVLDPRELPQDQLFNPNRLSRVPKASRGPPEPKNEGKPSGPVSLGTRLLHGEPHFLHPRRQLDRKTRPRASSRSMLASTSASSASGPSSPPARDVAPAATWSTQLLARQTTSRAPSAVPHSSWLGPCGGFTSRVKPRASRIEVRGFLALGGSPRRCGWTRLGKLVRPDPARERPGGPF